MNDKTKQRTADVTIVNAPKTIPFDLLGKIIIFYAILIPSIFLYSIPTNQMSIAYSEPFIRHVLPFLIVAFIMYATRAYYWKSLSLSSNVVVLPLLLMPYFYYLQNLYDGFPEQGAMMMLALSIFSCIGYFLLTIVYYLIRSWVRRRIPASLHN